MKTLFLVATYLLLVFLGRANASNCNVYDDYYDRWRAEEAVARTQITMPIKESLDKIWNKNLEYDLNFARALLNAGFDLKYSRHARTTAQDGVGMVYRFDQMTEQQKKFVRGVPTKIKELVVHFGGWFNDYTIELVPADGVSVEEAYADAARYYQTSGDSVFGQGLFISKHDGFNKDLISFRRYGHPSHMFGSESATYTLDVLYRVLGLKIQVIGTPYPID